MKLLKLSHLIKNRVNRPMRLSHQSGQLWDFVSSGNITSIIYKLLNRINHGRTGGALLPITSARTPGFVTEQFNGHTEEFQSRCFGTRPLLQPSWAEEDGGRGPEAELERHSAQKNTMWLSTSFISGAEKVSLRHVQIIEEGICVWAASHCCPRTVAAHRTDPASLMIIFQVKQLLVERNFN